MMAVPAEKSERIGAVELGRGDGYALLSMMSVLISLLDMLGGVVRSRAELRPPTLWILPRELSSP